MLDHLQQASSPEALLLDQIHERGRWWTKAVYEQALFNAIAHSGLDEVRAEHYVTTLATSAYRGFRYAIYVDPELVASGIFRNRIYGVPVPITGARTPKSAFIYPGRVEDIEQSYTPNTILLSRAVVPHHCVFTAFDPKDCGSDEDLLEQATDYGGLGLLRAGQQLNASAAPSPNSDIHMMLVPSSTLEFVPGVVETVVLERKLETRFLYRLLEKRGIHVVYADTKPDPYPGGLLA